MKKPNVFIVGAPRCGTTSLYRYLQQHPEVYMADCKEPEFFATDLPFRHAIRDREMYLSLFSNARDERYIGEASTFYLFSKVAAANIKNFSPQAKIIIMLRRPVDQMISFHNMILSLYWENSEDMSNFSEALAIEGLRTKGLHLPINNTMPKECYFYREIARYTEQVKRYLEIFGHENVHIIIFDDLKRDVAQVFKGVCDFLEIERDIRINLIRHNTVGSPRNHTVFRLLRNLPGNLRFGICKAVFAYLWQLNMSNQSPRCISSSLEEQLDQEFAGELLDLSNLLGRDLRKEWSIKNER